MRRVIAAAVTSGVVLGGAALTTPAFAAVLTNTHTKTTHTTKTAKTAPAAKAAKTAKAAKAAPATKTVVYQGYEFQVPSSWPVYRLDEHPQECVRYDVHAVYLGKPGPNQQCPAGLVGRTETVSFIPGRPGAAPATAAAGTANRASAPGAPAVRRLAAVHSVITQDAGDDELQVALGQSASAATVTGTYANAPAVVRQVLSSLRKAPAKAKDSAQSPAAPSAARAASQAAAQQATANQATANQAAPKQGAAPAAAKAPAKAAAPSPTYSSWRGVPSHWPVQIVSTPTPKPTPTPVTTPTPPRTPTPPPPVSTPGSPSLGFDTCAAPSIATMSAWRSAYSAVGIYVGGANAACPHGNLSASWVTSAAALGYGFLPTYVGRQAPCWSGRGLAISPAHAAAEGESAGADAVKQAQALGFGSGTPIYDDMEGYAGGSSCTSAVLNFLNAWDQRVTASGFRPAVYSSEASGIQDLQAAATKKLSGYTGPSALWIALWDNKPSLALGPLAWSQANLNKQYEGNVTQTVGGVKMNVDKDVVGSALAH